MTIVDCAAVELFVICILLGWIFGLYDERRLLRKRLREERGRVDALDGRLSVARAERDGWRTRARQASDILGKP